MMLRITLTTVARKPGHRGEHEENRKTIAQGMPVETGEPVEDYRILCGHGCIGHPAFPAPSSSRVALRPLTFGANELANLGRSVSRECGLMFQRHCEERSDEAIQCSKCGPWIASLRS